MDDDVGAQHTPAEVEATFRTLRRVGVGYFVVFLLAVAAFPVLSLTLDWWSQARLAGGMSPGFLVAAFGLYLFFAILGIAAARLSSAVEHRMLDGTRDDGPTTGPGLDGEHP